MEDGLRESPSETTDCRRKDSRNGDTPRGTARAKGNDPEAKAFEENIGGPAIRFSETTGGSLCGAADE
jgi:hypothetical protein